MSGKTNEDEDESSVMKPESRDSVDLFDLLSSSTSSLCGYAGGGRGGMVRGGLDSAWGAGASRAFLGLCRGCSFNSFRMRTCMASL